MSATYEEKRQFKRVYFSMEDAPLSLLGPADRRMSTLYAAQLVNLSEGGAGFSMQRSSAIVPALGQHLVIRDLKGPENLDFLNGIVMAVRWLLNSSAVRCIGFGCRFIDLPPDNALRIEALVAATYDQKQ